MSSHSRKNVPSLPSIETMLQEGSGLPYRAVRQQERRTNGAQFGHRRHVSAYTFTSTFLPKQILHESLPRVTPDTLPPLRLTSPTPRTAGIGQSPTSRGASLQHESLPTMIMQPKLRFTDDSCAGTAASTLSRTNFSTDMSCHHDAPAAVTGRRHYHSRSYSDMSNCTQQGFDKSSPHRYLCQYCYKAFSRPSSLRTHTYSHTGEKPFVCDVDGCHRRFNVHSNLRRHLKRHQAPVGSTRTRPSPRAEVANRSSLLVVDDISHCAKIECLTTGIPAPTM